MDIATEVPKFALGVIGLRPIIEPGKNFQYMSMGHLMAPKGTMEGSFLLENLTTKTPVEVEVAVCNFDPDVYATS